MSDVFSGSQRIIVQAHNNVSVVRGGPIGPPGINAGAATSADGEVSVPNSVWIINHNLQFIPHLWFETLDGQDELEPSDITHVSNIQSLATWPEPIAGKWYAS